MEGRSGKEGGVRAGEQLRELRYVIASEAIRSFFKNLNCFVAIAPRHDDNELVSVMAGLVPAIHVCLLSLRKSVDARD
jgi:hypothetical protein